MIDKEVIEKARKYSLDNPARFYILLSYTYNYKDEGPIDEWAIIPDSSPIPLEEEMSNIQIRHIFKNGEMIA